MIWTTHVTKEVETLWRSGQSLGVIARRFATTRNSIAGKIARLGLCGAGGRVSQWTPEREDKLIKLWRRGVTAADIAATLDPSGELTAEMVRSKRYRMGLPPRPGGSWR